MHEIEQQEDADRYGRLRSRIIEAGIVFAIAFVLVSTVRYYIAQPFMVSGGSMTPTFNQGDYLVIDRLSYRLHAPARGDVIIFRFPLDSSIYYVKRIVGLPGETVHIKAGTIAVSAAGTTTVQQLHEPYLSSELDTKTMQTVTLADDEYFVVGDNRAASSDSREWGPLQRQFIIGRAYARLWPLSQFSLLPGEYRFESSR